MADTKNLNGADCELLLQVLNQLPNFLAYSVRRERLEPLSKTLESVRTRIEQERQNKGEKSKIALDASEAEAVRVLIPEIIQSLGDLEFSLRTGYSIQQASEVLDHLS